MEFAQYTVSPDDYRAVSAVVPLEACAKKSCINFTVINDGTVEEDEVFFATLELTPGLDPRIKLTGRTRSRVTIIDSNCKCLLLYREQL